MNNKSDANISNSHIQTFHILNTFTCTIVDKLWAEMENYVIVYNGELHNGTQAYYHTVIIVHRYNSVQTPIKLYIDAK